MINRNSAPRVGPGNQYTVGATAVQYLGDNWAREYLEITNATGGPAILIGIGAAPTSTTGRLLSPGETWNPNPAPGDQIWLMAVTGTATVTIFGN